MSHLVRLFLFMVGFALVFGTDDPIARAVGLLVAIAAATYDPRRNR